MVSTRAQTASQPQSPLEETVEITYSLWRMGDDCLSWYSFELTNQQLSSKLQDKAVGNAILTQLNEHFNRRFRKKSIDDLDFLIPKVPLQEEATDPWTAPENWKDDFWSLEPAFALKEYINPNKSDILHMVITERRRARSNFESELEDELEDEVSEIAKSRRAMQQQKAKIKSPSQASQSSLYAAAQKDEAEVVCDGHHAIRGHLDTSSPPPTSSPPLTIFHPIFQKFLREVVELMEDACVIKTMDQGNTEPYYTRIMRPILGRICCVDITKFSTKADRRADGVYIITLKNGQKFAIVVWKNKRCIRATGSDVLVQVALLMKQLMSEAPEEIFRKCNCPTFMIATCGLWLCILGGVWADRVIVQRLTPLIPLVFSESAGADLAEFYQAAPFRHLEDFKPKDESQAK
ncbi:hypothetical protein L218DRAFT_1082170 [Marasmius fiardii PR-910]|nr:hypothetical protein L218DRAFT_1082170 [Marasmius fiardii PR-910]